jgi:hypothetical protein
MRDRVAGDVGTCSTVCALPLSHRRNRVTYNLEKRITRGRRRRHRLRFLHWGGGGGGGGGSAGRLMDGDASDAGSARTYLLVWRQAHSDTGISIQVMNPTPCGRGQMCRAGRDGWVGAATRASLAAFPQERGVRLSELLPTYLVHSEHMTPAPGLPRPGMPAHWSGSIGRALLA